MTTKQERKREIGKAITDAMRGLSGKEYDFTADSPEISAAEHALNEAMADYVDGNTSKANVRAVYQRWRDLHKIGATTT